MIRKFPEDSRNNFGEFFYSPNWCFFLNIFSANKSLELPGFDSTAVLLSHLRIIMRLVWEKNSNVVPNKIDKNQCYNVYNYLLCFFNAIEGTIGSGVRILLCLSSYYALWSTIHILSLEGRAHCTNFSFCISFLNTTNINSLI